ncbi:MAG TPA: MFS transporter [Mycobacteriales bacterium]|nr:MFS transporter [Mycobacteriales bacterium]
MAAVEVSDTTATRIFDRNYRLPVIGIIAVVTVVAIEAMAVTTVMPTVVRSLDGLRYYSWGFTAYLLADVVGMVDAGRRTDRDGPTPSLVGGMTIFAVGLVVAAVAPDIWVFLVGRVLQGVGGGSMIVPLYVVVARALPESLHGTAFALMSAAWVVPSLIGPGLAGLVASTVGWRWVFGGIAPLAVAGVLTLVPVLRAVGSDHRAPDEARQAARGGLVTGIRVALGLAAVQEAAQLASWVSIPMLVAAGAIAVPPLVRLLPAGAFRSSHGLGTVMVLRAAVTCAFFGAEAYLPLTLTQLHGGTPRTVGIPLTIASLGWSAGSWWQGRRNHGRVTSLQLGFIALACGIGLLLLVAQPSTSLWLAIPIWTVAGTGIGLVMPIVSVLVLELSPAAEQGANSAAIQLADITGSIVGIASVAALVNGLGLHHFTLAVSVGDAVLATVALCAAALAHRIESRRGMPAATAA